MRVAYVTTGTVGAGHFVRGLALQNALKRRGFSGVFAVFGPPIEYAAAQASSYESFAYNPDEMAQREAAERSPLAAALVSFAPDLLIVDLFWAPLTFIQPLLSAESWLLIRSCPPTWFEGSAEFQFDRRRFTRIFLTEPAGIPIEAERLEPIVICNPDECAPRDDLRDRLGVPIGHELVVAAHAGFPEEIEVLTAKAGAGANVLDLRKPDALFPLARWLGGADRLFLGGGYNSFWEAAWLGYARRTKFHPFLRRIDDQAWRVSACRWVQPKANGADQLAKLIDEAG